MFPHDDNTDEHDSLEAQAGANPDTNLTEIDVNELLQGKTEVYLVLNGVRYRLRRTRRNKLILQK